MPLRARRYAASSSPTASPQPHFSITRDLSTPLTVWRARSAPNNHFELTRPFRGSADSEPALLVADAPAPKGAPAFGRVERIGQRDIAAGRFTRHAAELFVVSAYKGGDAMRMVDLTDHEEVGFRRRFATVTSALGVAVGALFLVFPANRYRVLTAASGLPGRQGVCTLVHEESDHRDAAQFVRRRDDPYWHRRPRRPREDLTRARQALRLGSGALVVSARHSRCRPRPCGQRHVQGPLGPARPRTVVEFGGTKHFQSAARVLEGMPSQLLVRERRGVLGLRAVLRRGVVAAAGAGQRFWPAASQQESRQA